MYQFPIGAIVDSFNLETREAIKAAAAIGAKGIQMYSTNGVNSPANLVGQARKDLLNYVKDNGMVFSAICGDLGQGFMHREKNPDLIDQSKRIMELAKDLESDVVTTHIGVVPADRNHDRYKIMQEACFELAQYADSMGSHFAIETGPERAATLKMFLDDLGSTGVAVNLDPANLVMVTGDDPVQAVHNLAPYIVHTHAKDGVMLHTPDPEVVYGLTNGTNETENGPCFEEVPLGKGSVPFVPYLDALEAIGYKGFLTIEREVGPCPADDIALAVNFLKERI